ncbi:hypothetical protein [Rhizobium halophytocola]|uniref:Uncharacterized protein n=1 Tax=Rhizobium halophytocola TaxID=735519 RepID=A0ABS4DYX9_9HYPH|nr:hypothetical protein [Rhizobium halophytocola]MBP1850893.1 hypothetical protein [Rhizobium halophytocola]
MSSARAIAIFAAVAVVYAVGTHIPLPGADPKVLANMAPGAIARISIFALGTGPLLAVFGWIELARLVPYRPDWGRDDRLRRIGRIVVKLLVLALAALQGRGIAASLAAGGLVPAEFDLFPPLAVGSYVGATAIFLFLSDRIRLTGLRNGFWLLWCMPVLAGLPSALAAAFDMSRGGALSPSIWALGGGLLVLSVGLLVLAAGLWQAVWQRAVSAGTPPSATAPLEILIWPIVLSEMATVLLLNLLAMVAPMAIGELSPVLEICFLVLQSLLIVPFVFAYLRQGGVGARNNPLAVATALGIAGLQILLVWSNYGLMLGNGFPPGIGGLSVAALTVSFLGLLGARRRGVRRAR